MVMADGFLRFRQYLRLSANALTHQTDTFLSAKPTFKATWPNPKPTGETNDGWAHCESVRANTWLV